MEKSNIKKVANILGLVFINMILLSCLISLITDFNDVLDLIRAKGEVAFEKYVWAFTITDLIGCGIIVGISSYASVLETQSLAKKNNKPTKKRDLVKCNVLIAISFSVMSIVAIVITMLFLQDNLGTITSESIVLLILFLAGLILLTTSLILKNVAINSYIRIVGYALLLIALIWTTANNDEITFISILLLLSFFVGLAHLIVTMFIKKTDSDNIDQQSPEEPLDM